MIEPFLAMHLLSGVLIDATPVETEQRARCEPLPKGPSALIAKPEHTVDRHANVVAAMLSLQRSVTPTTVDN